jgi:hypothetical protein
LLSLSKSKGGSAAFLTLSEFLSDLPQKSARHREHCGRTDLCDCFVGL